MNKKKLLIIFFSLLLLSSLFSVKYFGITTTVDLDISLGINYYLNISTDYSSFVNNYKFSIPVGFSIDTRYIEWFSLEAGIDFLYSLQSIGRSVSNIPYQYYYHRLYIEIPFGIKFYPLVYKNDRFWNFNLGIEGLLHFCAVNAYYVENQTNSQIDMGNAYFPKHNELDPGNIYSPANIGIRLLIGNHFQISSRTLLGLRLYLDYLFIPITNGYYSNNYSRGGNTLVEFSLKIGVLFSLRIRLKGAEPLKK